MRCWYDDNFGPPVHLDVKQRTPIFVKDGQRFALTAASMPLCLKCCRGLASQYGMPTDGSVEGEY